MYNPVMQLLDRFFGLQDIPRQYRRNFTNLFLDMAWVGVLSGSTLAFLSIYAARLGASTFQVGLLGAMPAVVNLFFAIPTGQWLQSRAIGKAVFWTSVLYRFGYLCLVPLPWLFADQSQVWALILLALFMGIPGTALAVGFNALFAEAVPTAWRARVAGNRNVVLALVYVITTILCGVILNRMPFPTGYQVVFGIGFLGAAMSSFHLFFVKSLVIPLVDQTQPKAGLEQANPHGLRDWIARIQEKFLRVDLWKSPFRKVLLVLFFFHLSQFLTIPLFPIYFVNNIHLNDQQIGIGTAVFYLTVFLGSTQLARICHKLGTHKVTGVGAIAMSLYPILLSFSGTYLHYLVVSFIGGFSWSMVGGALANYLLEKIPESDRPAHLAWYNIVLNAAILGGSLIGPVFSIWLGVKLALLILGFSRLGAGLVILKWG